jgi:hypothetical protein
VVLTIAATTAARQVMVLTLETNNHVKRATAHDILPFLCCSTPTPLAHRSVLL